MLKNLLFVQTTYNFEWNKVIEDTQDEYKWNENNNKKKIEINEWKQVENDTTKNSTINNIVTKAKWKYILLKSKCNNFSYLFYFSLHCCSITITISVTLRFVACFSPLFFFSSTGNEKRSNKHNKMNRFQHRVQNFRLCSLNMNAKWQKCINLEQSESNFILLWLRFTSIFCVCLIFLSFQVASKTIELK